jgi:hypothetical protein
MIFGFGKPCSQTKMQPIFAVFFEIKKTASRLNLIQNKDILF